MQTNIKKGLELGQGLVEYALILVLVGVVVIAILSVFGESLQRSFNCILISIEVGGGDTPFTGFTLINADTDTPIQAVTCGGRIDLSNLPTNNLDIRADARGSLGSVRFTLSGPTSRTQTENFAPYALFGDSGGDFHGGTFSPGDYELTATAFSESGGGGDNLGSLTIEFSVE